MTTISSRLRAKLRDAESICVLTGAGVSAESGVPTFRSENGLWKKFKPEELANFNAFMKNPQLVWDWYEHRRQVIKEVKPNPAHYSLAELEQLVPKFTLVTQNVDNLHRRAGSQHILELHGNIERSYCVACGKFATEADMEKATGNPRCAHCGGLVRPDVVWFGELLPQDVFEEAEQSARSCDVFLCIGTSAVVYPAASLPLLAREVGAYVVEVNKEYTELSGQMNETLVGLAGSVVPEIVRAAKEERKKA